MTGDRIIQVTTGEYVIALQENGELLLVEASVDACKVLAKTKVVFGRCWTTPVISGGRIYLRNAAGDVVCVDVVK